jgi:hypothetical protein
VVLVVVVLVEPDDVVDADCFVDPEPATPDPTVVSAALVDDTVLGAATVEEGPADELAV